MSEQEIMQSNFHAIVKGITQIMNATCSDPSVLKIWKEEAVNWFAEIDRTAHIKYWNLAPEVIVDMKWAKLWNVLDVSLSIQTPVHEWEKQVADFILNIEWTTSNDEEKNTNKQIHNTPEEPVDHDYYEDEEEREEQRQLGRMERAASRNDERRRDRY